MDRFLAVWSFFFKRLWGDIKGWKETEIVWAVGIYVVFVYGSRLYNTIFYSQSFNFLHSYLIIPFDSGRLNSTTLWIFWLGGLALWFLRVCVATIKYYITTKNNGSY